MVPDGPLFVCGMVRPKRPNGSRTKGQGPKAKKAGACHLGTTWAGGGVGRPSQRPTLDEAKTCGLVHIDLAHTHMLSFDPQGVPCTDGLRAKTKLDQSMAH